MAFLFPSWREGSACALCFSHLAEGVYLFMRNNKKTLFALLRVSPNNVVDDFLALDKARQAARLLLLMKSK